MKRPVVINLPDNGTSGYGLIFKNRLLHTRLDQTAYGAWCDNSTKMDVSSDGWPTGLGTTTAQYQRTLLLFAPTPEQDGGVNKYDWPDGTLRLTWDGGASNDFDLAGEVTIGSKTPGTNQIDWAVTDIVASGNPQTFTLQVANLDTGDPPTNMVLAYTTEIADVATAPMRTVVADLIATAATRAGSDYQVVLRWGQISDMNGAAKDINGVKPFNTGTAGYWTTVTPHATHRAQCMQPGGPSIETIAKVSTQTSTVPWILVYPMQSDATHSAYAQRAWDAGLRELILEQGNETWNPAINKYANWLQNNYPHVGSDTNRRTQIAYAGRSTRIAYLWRKVWKANGGDPAKIHLVLAYGRQQATTTEQKDNVFQSYGAGREAAFWSTANYTDGRHNESEPVQHEEKIMDPVNEAEVLANTNEQNLDFIDAEDIDHYSNGSGYTEYLGDYLDYANGYGKKIVYYEGGTHIVFAEPGGASQAHIDKVIAALQSSDARTQVSEQMNRAITNGVWANGYFLLTGNVNDGLFGLMPGFTEAATSHRWLGWLDHLDALP